MQHIYIFNYIFMTRNQNIDLIIAFVEYMRVNLQSTATIILGRSMGGKLILPARAMQPRRNVRDRSFAAICQLGQ